MAARVWNAKGTLFEARFIQPDEPRAGRLDPVPVWAVEFWELTETGERFVASIGLADLRSKSAELERDGLVLAEIDDYEMKLDGPAMVQVLRWAKWG
jgi:hypothetical protein